MPEHAHNDPSEDRLAATIALRLGQREADAVKALADRAGVGSSALLRHAVRQLVENPRVYITQQPVGSAGDLWANGRWEWTATSHPGSWTGDRPG